MTDSACTICDCPEPAPAAPRATPPARTRPTLRSWPALLDEAGMPAEGHDVHGQEFPGTLRAGGDLGPGGP